MLLFLMMLLSFELIKTTQTQLIISLIVLMMALCCYTVCLPFFIFVDIVDSSYFNTHEKVGFEILAKLLSFVL